VKGGVSGTHPMTGCGISGVEPVDTPTKKFKTRVFSMEFWVSLSLIEIQLI
jgi:hypothetical protein